MPITALFHHFESGGLMIIQEGPDNRTTKDLHVDFQGEFHRI